MMLGVSPATAATSSSSAVASGPPAVAAPNRRMSAPPGGGSGAAAWTVNTADALMDEVFAVTVTFPVEAAGIVTPVLKVPVVPVLKANVAEPMITVPVVAALNPVPATVTAEPAGPEAGLKVIAAGAAAAAAGCTAARTSPVPTNSAMPSFC